MGLLEVKAAAVQRLVEPWVAIPLGIAVVLLAIASFFWPADPNAVPVLSDTIPFVSNTYQYMTDMRTFLSRANHALRRKNIARFYLGPMKVYLVAGARNIQVLFRSSENISSDKFILLVIEHIWGAPKEDVAKFANDKSGRLKLPAPGTEDTPPEKRYWANYHRVFHENLARAQETNKLADAYQQHFGERLGKLPIGKWTDVRIFELLKADMATAATISLAGSRILELNPNLIQMLWDFDMTAALLPWGLPRWMNKLPWERRDRLRAACGRWIESASDGFDWDGPEGSSDWEPKFGSRFSRELVRFLKESGLAPMTCAGAVMGNVIFGSNSNTIPVTTWGIMELAKDRDLLEAVREEVMTAYVTDPVTQERVIDAQALLALPLLQAVYAEALRLHVSINVTREVIHPIVLEGYRLGKGALLQAPSEIVQSDERVWGVKGHPASKFWPGRHLSYVDATGVDGKVGRVPQFSMAGRTNDFIPYGGGVSVCPGRHFAKQEIMLTLGMLITRFEIEFVEWTNHDGSPSDRPAGNDVRWAGGAAVPPDRDMRLRWKKLW